MEVLAYPQSGKRRNAQKDENNEERPEEERFKEPFQDALSIPDVDAPCQILDNFGAGGYNLAEGELLKLKEQQEARRMRRDNGLALSEIAARLGVAKSTVSVWVRDIVLSDVQVAQLVACNPVYNGQFLASQASKSKALAARRAYQEAGKALAVANDPLHIAGCMLYWAEGSKGRCDVAFTNSDPEMLIFFIRFLEICYKVLKSDISLYINCFDDQFPVTEIENFWLERLQLPSTQLRKTTLNYFSARSKQQRITKLKYGTCRLVVHRTEIVQNIFGAIQGYAGMRQERWLD